MKWLLNSQKLLGCHRWISLSTLSSINSVQAICLFLLLFSFEDGKNGVTNIGAINPVYIRSNSFGQLITSNTLRWIRGQDKSPVTLESGQIICRVTQSGLREIGLLSTDKGECNINSEDDPKMISSSRNYQTLSGHAARLSWMYWERPNEPPTGAISITEKQQKFVAAPLDMQNTIGYMDPRLNLGSAVFPQDIPASTSAKILVEIDPVRYELYDIDLKKTKDFTEQEIVLARGKLKYENLETGEGDEGQNELDTESRVGVKSARGDGDIGIGRIETVLTFEKESTDYWGNGNLMAKGLDTYIDLPKQWAPDRKIINWGIPLEQPSVNSQYSTIRTICRFAPKHTIN